MRGRPLFTVPSTLVAGARLVSGRGDSGVDGMAILHPYRTCPVQTCGHAGTNPGRAAGRDLQLLRQSPFGFEASTFDGSVNFGGRRATHF